MYSIWFRYASVRPGHARRSVRACCGLGGMIWTCDRRRRRESFSVCLRLERRARSIDRAKYQLGCWQDMEWWSRSCHAHAPAPAPKEESRVGMTVESNFLVVFREGLLNLWEMPTITYSEVHPFEWSTVKSHLAYFQVIHLCERSSNLYYPILTLKTTAELLVIDESLSRWRVGLLLSSPLETGSCGDEGNVSSIVNDLHVCVVGVPQHRSCSTEEKKKRRYICTQTVPNVDLQHTRHCHHPDESVR